jgi:hypothetical protein
MKVTVGVGWRLLHFYGCNIIITFMVPFVQLVFVKMTGFFP